jgi:hypothetical protein
VEDGICAVGQAHAQLGGGGARKDVHGGIYFRIQRQIKPYKKEDAPPLRVKPVPIIIIIFIVAQAYGVTWGVTKMAIADMIVVAFFFLLRQGEYTGTLSDDAAFKIKDVSLYVQGRKLGFSLASNAEIKASTSASYTFTTQKNNNRNEKLVQGVSCDPWCCTYQGNSSTHVASSRSHVSMHRPVRIILPRQSEKLVKAKDITEFLRNATWINVHRIGIDASEVSAQSLHAGARWTSSVAIST